MTHAALQDDFKILPEAVIGQFHRKAPVTADRNSGVTALILLAGSKDRFACLFLIREPSALHLHSDKILFGKRVRRQCFQVLLESGDIPFVPFDIRREYFQQLILQTVLLALMICLQNLQPCHFHVQIHLLPDQRIAGAECLDLRIGKCLLIHIVTGTDR